MPPLAIVESLDVFEARGAASRRVVQGASYQRAFYGGRYIGCDIGNPRYDAFARLCGAEGYYAETPDQVGYAVKAALGCGKPAVVEIPIDPDEFPTPVAAVGRDRAGARA
jgi:thiamine pyrophosphate-dependent acetolactate synthase large subunit-like protein